MQYDNFEQTGIRLKSHSNGDHHTTCPECSSGRKKKSDPCLSIAVEGDTYKWFCHHCEFKGAYSPENKSYTAPKRKKVVIPKIENKDISPAALNYFKKRGISIETLATNDISTGMVYMPQVRKEVSAILFPYYSGDEIVNIKYRDHKKNFTQTKGGEKIFYGIDQVEGSDSIVVCEGEMDKLSFNEAGIWNAISVPDGAPAKLKEGEIDKDNDRKFSYVWECDNQLKDKKKIILAVDSDGAGQALMAELSRRLGTYRCWFVTYPEGCKDANDVLVEYGKEALSRMINEAKQYPIDNVHDVMDFKEDVLQLYRNGIDRAASTGIKTLDGYYRVAGGELTIVTGIPGSGKSEFIDAIMLNMADLHGWKCGVCSFENEPKLHILKLLEKFLNKPFWKGVTARMTDDDIDLGFKWLSDRVKIMQFTDDSPATIDDVIEAARCLVVRYGIKGLIVDPYNEIDHKRAAGQTETEYVSELISKVKRFAKNYNVHVWFVAHPAKMYKHEGKIPVPTLYDISGSANWYNKADNGIVVHRNDESGVVEIHIRKVRHKSTGEKGMVELTYNKTTGRYSGETDWAYRTPNWEEVI